ncbi:MAG: hypothetical protein OHK0046_22500 [Anaerolineae bacterium]
MQFGRAFSYIITERDWIGKLGVIAVLTFAAVFMMILIGLGFIPLAVLIGYMLRIMQQVRHNQKPMLPEWDSAGDLLALGSRVLPALIVYNLPLVLMSLCLLLVPGAFRSETTDALATLTSLICLLPLMILYVAITWPMLAVACARYMGDGTPNEFFKFGLLYETSSAIRAESIQWFLSVVAVLVIAFMLLFIPFIGWLAIAMLFFPVQGHLLGQYARLLDAHRKRKNAALRT